MAIAELDSVISHARSLWRGGTRPDALAYLREQPDLADSKSIMLELAYEEYLHRTESDEEIDVRSFANQFPDCQVSLQRRIDVYLALASELAGLDDDVWWPEAGERVGDFELVQELGRGAASRVFVSRQTSLNDRLVVVKLSTHGAREAQLMSRLEHPNVVPIMSVETDHESGLVAICMPFLTRWTLHDLLVAAYLNGSKPKTFMEVLERLQVDEGLIKPVAEVGEVPDFLRNATFADGVFHIVKQVGEALRHTHQRSIYHLDLKPSNILLTEAGTPLLLDFNLSADASAETSYGGTLPYMSPEQLRVQLGDSDAVVDAGSDIYSVGVILYELLSGTAPFKPAPDATSSSRSIARSLLKAQTAGPPRSALGAANVDSKTIDTIASCLSFDRSARPGSMVEFSESLDRSFGWTSRLARWYKPRRRYLAAAVVAVLVVVGFVRAFPLLTAFFTGPAVAAPEPEVSRELTLPNAPFETHPLRRPPEHDYILSFIANRIEGDGELGIGLPIGGKMCWLEIDRRDSTSRSISFRSSDDQLVGQRTVANESFLPRGRSVSVVCKVRGDTVRCFVDGNERAVIKVTEVEQAPPGRWNVAETDVVVVGSNDAEFHLKSIELVAVQSRFVELSVSLGEPIEIVPELVLQQDAICGDIHQVRDAIAMWGSGQVQLQIPYQPPAEYKLDIELTQNHGTSPVEINLPINGRACTLVLHPAGGDKPSTVTVRQDGVEQEYTYRSSLFQANVRQAISCTVLDDLLLVTCAGEEVFRIEGPRDGVVGSPDQLPPLPSAPAISCNRLVNNNAIIIHSIQLTPITGATKSLRSPPMSPEISRDDLVDYAANRDGSHLWVKVKSEGLPPGWTMEDNTIISPLAENLVLPIESSVPEEFEFELTVTRNEGVGELRVIVPNHGVVVLDGGPDNKTCGLELVDGLAVGDDDNPSATERDAPLIKPGKPTKVLCIFRNSGVRVLCNDKQIIKWNGAPKQLRRPRESPALGIGTSGPATRIDGLIVREIIY